MMPKWYLWTGDAGVCRYERWQPHPDAGYSRGYIVEALDYDASDCLYYWGIQLEGRLIGSVCIVNISNYDQKAVLGYCLAEDFWSVGYTTEAVRAVLHSMFTEVGLHRMEAAHSVNNIASGRILEKSGLVLEGVAQGYYFSNVGFQDSRLFGITREQYLCAK